MGTCSVFGAFYPLGQICGSFLLCILKFSVRFEIYGFVFTFGEFSEHFLTISQGFTSEKKH
ncbi:CLUMA_CG011813, isoform A [Clunio marinus]|uniref:CLUMA_CG011813, isoform A n=1 Tax=Clunio marinus TaxID=568069 RepID=A0A1J1IE19_9DIPT|nr:CLUMA_CG011813, isoform A [Clunio marinus]